MKYLSLIIALALSTTFYACQESPEQAGSETETTTQNNDINITEETEIVVKSGTQECVKRIIEMDNKLSVVRNEFTKNQPLSQTIKEYLTEMGYASYAGCPSTLEPAMKKHFAAWRSIIPVTDKYEDKRGEMAVLFKELEESADSVAVKAFVQQSYDTWMEVTRIVNENK